MPKFPAWPFAVSAGLHLVAFLYLGGHLERRYLRPIDVSYIPGINGNSVAPEKPRSAGLPKGLEKHASEPRALSASSNADFREKGRNSVPQISGKGHAPSDVIERYLAEVADLLNSKKRYPISARRLGQQGRVIVRLEIARDGRVTSKKIISPAPFESLNSAAQSLIEEIKGLRPFPQEIDAASWEVTVPIEYKLKM